jgi:hypothetical protein
MAGQRLGYEIDPEVDESLVTAHAGVPGVVEAFRQCGAAAVVDRLIRFKARKRGLTSSQMCGSLLALWAAGGECCEDFEHFRQDRALPVMLGHDLPAPQTVRDFLEQFHEDGLPLLQEGKATVPSESAALQALAAANKELIHDLQCRKPCRIATLDADGTIIASSKRAAKRTFEGERGFQPTLVVWAEQDVILTEEFRDGNVPAGSGNRRVIEKAVGMLPVGIDLIEMRGDSAFYELDLMTWMDARGIRYAISADMSAQLKAKVAALPEAAWASAGEEADAIREWAEVTYVPDDGIYKKDHVTPRRYLAIRIRPKQGELLACGEKVRHFAIVTNKNDPEGGSGLDIIRWHRKKAGTIEHVHDVVKNDLAGRGLPSQLFGANAAWLRLNTILYNLLTLMKRVGLPEELHDARPKRLRFLLLNTAGTVIRHAREIILRCVSDTGRRLADAARTPLGLVRPKPPSIGRAAIAAA